MKSPSKSKSNSNLSNAKISLLKCLKQCSTNMRRLKITMDEVILKSFCTIKYFRIHLMKDINLKSFSRRLNLTTNKTF